MGDRIQRHFLLHPWLVIAALLLAACGGSGADPQLVADNDQGALIADEASVGDADEAKPTLADEMEWAADELNDERAVSAGGGRGGRLALVAGAIGGVGYADRPGSKARFDSLRNIAVGPDDAIYVTEWVSQQPESFPTLIRRIARDGRLSTALGQRDFAPCTPPGAEPPFDRANSVARDMAGNFYLPGFAGQSYSSDWLLRRAAPDKRLTTLFGTITPCGTGIQRDGLFGPSSALGTEPVHVQLAVNGDVYLGDQTSLKKVSPTGAVSVIATFSELADPFGGSGLFSFARDAAGNLYAAHTFASVVSKFSADGRLLARFGVPFETGSSDGTSGARFNEPAGIALDAAGNVYVADAANHTIRKITRSGVVSTFAGAVGQPGRVDGVGPTARLNFPNAIAFDPGSGRLVFTDAGSRLVRAVSLDGQVTTLAGSPPAQPGDRDGPALQARLDRPFGADADKRGNVYIAGGQRNTVRKLVLRADGTRTLITIAGKAGEFGYVDGPVAQARFGTIVDVAVAADGRVIYVADAGNTALRKIDAQGMVTTLARFESGPPPATPAGLVILADNSVLVSAPINGVVYRVTQQGEVTVYAGTENDLGSADGPRLQARFNAPQSLALGPDGSVYVGDSGNHTIRRIARDGRVSTVAGSVGEAGLRDGTGTLARLGLVGDMAVDAHGRVYFTQQSFDPPWSAVRVLSPEGNVRTLIGDGIYQGVALGPVRKAGLNLASGVAVVGNALYINDLYENAVLKLKPR